MTEQKLVHLNEKWIEAQNASFFEVEGKDKEKRLYLEATIIPFGKVSRNGVLYNRESIEKTHKMLEGKPLMFNHVTKGNDVFPRGEWEETWLEKGGMKGKARVYNAKYNSDLIEYLREATAPKVSLQVTGGASQRKEEKTGEYYREAFIDDWLEASIVNVPGFIDASANFASAMAEAFGDDPEEEEEGDNSISESQMSEIDMLVGDLKKKGKSEEEIVKEIQKKYQIDEDSVKKMIADKEGMYKKKKEELFNKLSEARKKVFGEEYKKGDSLKYKDGNDAGIVAEVTELGYIVKPEDSEDMFFVQKADAKPKQ